MAAVGQIHGVEADAPKNGMLGRMADAPRRSPPTWDVTRRNVIAGADAAFERRRPIDDRETESALQA
jgi:hypothetical protein